jgi:hypothetical protein
VFDHLDVPEGRIWLKQSGVKHFAGDLPETEQKLVYATSMGGYGSGRNGGPPTVESALRLDIDNLVRRGAIELGVVVRDLAGGLRLAAARYGTPGHKLEPTNAIRALGRLPRHCYLNS